MTLRRTFFMLLGAFALLSAGAGLWQLADSRSKTAAAEWIRTVGRMVDIAQQASAQLAMERGITAVILARPAEASPSLTAELQQVRSTVDRLHEQLAATANQLERHAPEHPMFQLLARMRHGRAEMERLRGQVDEQLRGTPNELHGEQWILLATRRIEELQGLVAVGMLPLADNIYTYASLPIIKDLLFTLAEHLGRERAVIGAAIAQGTPLGEAELHALRDYRAVTMHARLRTEAIFGHLPASAELSRAQETFKRDLLLRYEATRAGVYQNGIEGLPYPVSAEAWYHEATRGIDAVTGLATAIGAQFERDTERLRRHAVRTQGLLAFIVCVLTLLFGFAMYALRRRVLQPLHRLERAAARIAAGDLSQALAPDGKDELGQLTRSFEHMRQTLVADIEHREADARELRKLNTMIEHSASAVFITDAAGIIEYTNARFSVITGYSGDEAIGRKAGFWRSGLGSPAQYQEMWETIRRGQVWEGELINRRRNGSLYWAALRVSPVLDERGAITHFIGVQHDISERRKVEDRLNFLASYDELTGLPNRNLLAERFAQAAADAHRDGTRVALVSLGLGRFKRINDSLGREAGDELLSKIAGRLSQCARSHDTVSRHGGTEFTLMFTALQQVGEIQAMLERIIDIVRVPVIVKGEKLQPTVAAGVSLLPDDGETLDMLLRKATIALHHAEAQGLSYCVYTDALDRDTQERLSLENALRQSLERGTLELHYQPKVDLASGRTVAVEALARWRHPVSGEYVPPQRFIPIAEESGLIQQLGSWALAEACRQNKAWQAAGLPVIATAVNLSAAQLRQPDLVEVVAATLERSGLDAALLELELTESALMEDPDQANLTLTRLKRLGLRLAIDDFGTGYSSLAYLSEFPVDQLKIDRRFVRDALSNPAAAAISSSVIALAHRMGLQVVAEGVETEAQLAFLRRHGCDQMQGYHYSRPLPATELAVLLGSDRRLLSPEQPRARTLLIVDDDPAIHTALAVALGDGGYRILTAHGARAALELLASHEVQVIISDERMPDMSGSEFFSRVKTLYPDTVRIMLSGYLDAGDIIRAINEGTIYKFVPKPWNDEQLRAHILEAFDRGAAAPAAPQPAPAVPAPA